MTLDEWDSLSIQNIESLTKIYDNLVMSISLEAKKFEKAAKVEKQQSLVFLVVCFATLISSICS